MEGVRFDRLVHPTQHNANPNLLVDGLPLALGARHAKVRRDGYRASATGGVVTAR